MKHLLLLLSTFVSVSIMGHSQTVTPHPVPEEFASDYYEVTVNGQSVPVFHAGLNVYFASFDFTGYWRGMAVVRPLSRKITPQLSGSAVSFSLAEAKVLNSFIRSMDDCFAFFTPGSSQNIWGPATASMYSRTSDLKNRPPSLAYKPRNSV